MGRIHILGSIVVSIPACHAGDRGSIPRRGGYNFSADPIRDMIVNLRVYAVSNGNTLICVLVPGSSE